MTRAQISAEKRAALCETKRKFRAAHPEYVAEENRRRREAHAKRRKAAAYQQRCTEIRASLGSGERGSVEARV
jgi:hypothetical protein